MLTQIEIEKIEFDFKSVTKTLHSHGAFTGS